MTTDTSRSAKQVLYPVVLTFSSCQAVAHCCKTPFVPKKKDGLWKSIWFCASKQPDYSIKLYLQSGGTFLTVLSTG